VLFTVGAYITHYPVENIDELWRRKALLKENDTSTNVTLDDIPDISSERAELTQERIEIFALFIILIILILVIYSCFPRKEFKEKVSLTLEGAEMHPSSAKI